MIVKLLLILGLALVLFTLPICMERESHNVGKSYSDKECVWMWGWFALGLVLVFGMLCVLIGQYAIAFELPRQCKAACDTMTQTKALIEEVKEIGEGLQALELKKQLAVSISNVNYYTARLSIVRDNTFLYAFRPKEI